jgi:hypothetical protein
VSTKRNGSTNRKRPPLTSVRGRGGEKERYIMLGITMEWWILYALILVLALIALRSFMNGVRILAAELRETRNNVRQLDGPEILRELKAIKYIIEGLESNYDGFVLKEKVDNAQDLE